MNGSPGAVTMTDNIFGTEAGTGVTFDADGNCTSENCTVDDEPVGYRKPSGVNW
jgi:hypothetical protein